MDLHGFVTILLYEYEWFLCVRAFTLLLCFIFEAVLHWIHCFAISMGVCITAYYLYLHFLEISWLAAEEARENAELAALLPTLNDGYVRDTITRMWADLWLAYRLALISPRDNQGRFDPCYRGRVHYSVPLMNVSLHYPSPDTRWALPYRYQLRFGEGSRIE